MEGFYDDWALRERERLRGLYLNGLAYLMRYHRHHGAHDESMAYGQEILRLDPLREEIHREMIHLYIENGQRALAIRQYALCREVLADELGIQPMEETRALYTQIAPLHNHNSQAPKQNGPSTGLSLAIQQLHLAMFTTGHFLPSAAFGTQPG